MVAFWLLAAIVVGTWNGNWFPSGRAEHRAHPAVEAATITAAGEMLEAGLKQIDPTGKEEVILCLNEVRNLAVASNLAERICRPGLKVAVISDYRRRDRFDQQQDVILTTLPVVETKCGKWTTQGDNRPPRGYAFAALVVSPAVTARVYAVHLKSNYGQGRNLALADLNREKRSAAITEILSQERGSHVIVAGDMNADRWRKQFALENFFGLFDAAKFVDLLSLLPPKQRGTYPSRTYGDSALDHIFVRGFTPVGVPRIVPNDELSDHLAVFGRIDCDECFRLSTQK